jgi:hypothetical protein
MLVKSRPELDVRLLIWKSPLLIAASQGFFPHRAHSWFRKRMVEFRLDPPPRHRRLPSPEGGHHRRRRGLLRRRRHLGRPLGFCEHLDQDPRRCMPSGLIAPPGTR